VPTDKITATGPVAAKMKRTGSRTTPPASARDFVAIADRYARDAIAVAAPWNAPRLLAIVNQVIDDRPTELNADDVIALYRASIAVEGTH
jgi:hypothetical protein